MSFTLHSQCLVLFPLGFSSTIRSARNSSNWNCLIRPTGLARTCCLWRKINPFNFSHSSHRFHTRMHSSRMHTACSRSRLLGGVCLSACWDIHTPLVWVWRPPSLGVGLETPLARPLNFPPWVWAWRPPCRPLNFPPGCGPGDPPPDPSTSPLGVDLETPLQPDP